MVDESGRKPGSDAEPHAHSSNIQHDLPGQPAGSASSAARSESATSGSHEREDALPHSPLAPDFANTSEDDAHRIDSAHRPSAEAGTEPQHRSESGSVANSSPSSPIVAPPKQEAATSTSSDEVGTEARRPRYKDLYASVRGLWQNGWLKEILSWTAAILIFTATIVVLVIFDGKRLPELAGGLTLNGLISILTTMMKTSLALCLSGPLGQLKWNWFSQAPRPLDDMRTFDRARTEGGILRMIRKLGSLHLHTLGAFLVSLQLGFDTSFQQTVHYPSVSVASTVDNATIANAIDAGFANSLTPGSIDTDLLAAVYEGVFGNPAATGAGSLPMYCPSGNCSWTDVISFGLCYRCANVTTDLSHFGNYSALCIGSPAAYDSTACGPAVLLSDRPLAQDVPSYQLYTITEQNQSTAFRHLPFFLASFVVLEIPATYMPLENDFPISFSWQVWATECAFEYCYQTFDITYESGSINRYLQNISQAVDQIHNLTAFPPIGSEEITPALATVLNGTIYGDQYSSNAVVARFFSFNNLYSMAANISASLGIWFGTSTAFAGDPAIGTVWVQETQVRVSWPWITLPAFLLAASGTFLFAAMFQTRQQTRKNPSLGIWKNNALAPFFHGLDNVTRDALGPGRNVKEMKGDAQKVLVRLEDGPGGVARLQSEKDQ
ncbi:hypothetical protein PV04_09171 [Phialophora macrospora]|uniref:Uncharacterized protein n=1 Tax=Phialophora macrospora TaxID=1851006 RepID=A0A0D2FBH8_9EURO|nr:hypothetical protein PV04_09171 [Phialophora macrospora]